LLDVPFILSDPLPIQGPLQLTWKRKIGADSFFKPPYSYN
jgi:hypothetical protein